MIRRLRIKFVCINMVIVTVMLVVIFGTVFHFTRKNLQQQSLQALELAANDRKRPGRPGEHPDHILLPFFTVTVTSDGNIVLGNNDYFDLSDEEMIRELVQIANSSESTRGILPRYQLRFDRFNTPLGQKIVFLDISGEIETVSGLFRTCLTMGLLSFTAFLGISILLANWAIRPVEKAWNQQKQFVADASHELKTPLTVIMTNAELLQDPGYDAMERQQFSQSILTVSQQMRGLVESLLELASADNDSRKMEFESLDLSELTADTLLLFEPIYFENGLQLQSDVQETLRVKGSRNHLRQVLEILLDNGVKYSTPGGTVQVLLTRQGHRCLLSVFGPGEAISRENLKNIFKRFYRIDKARSRNGSYGLGLSIAWSIVSAHGGKIWAESANGINTFYVQLNLTA